MCHEEDKNEIRICPELSPEENLNRITEGLKKKLEGTHIVELDPNNEEDAEFIKAYTTMAKIINEYLKSMTAIIARDTESRKLY